MFIFHPTQRLGKISKILAFSESGQLRNIIQANIDKALGTRST
ncbi:hypothetical protein CSB95_3859 [Pseudomonas aeruginosa]|nr:hypothetical protein CSC29_1924 [Pseudomonas aeruginosa]PRW09755.1 hypothetical protein CSB95_3859 [Pseudomonas aeruginosa]